MDEPFLEEIVRALKKPNNGSAMGPDGIPPELLKYAIGPISSTLHSIVVEVRRSDLLIGKTESSSHYTKEKASTLKDRLYYRYRPISEAISGRSYRPISLLSVPGMVFASVLLARIQPLLNRTRRPKQSVSTSGRSTIGAILDQRPLSELHREFDRPLNVAFS